MDNSLLEQELTQAGVRSCLISRNQKLVFEHYRNEKIAQEPAKINSCTKSFLSALVCISMDQGILPEVNALASDFFPELAKDEDSRKRTMTLEHLLTMTAGFKWQEFGGLNSFPHMTRTPNWITYVLSQPLADPPGARMEYNSGVSQMLSACLSRSAGMSTARYAEIHLFEPLGIKHYYWEQDPQGYHTGGFGLWLRPSDLLKFGQLFLQQGRFEGRQLISQELAVRSVQPVVQSEHPRQGGYGWHWWADDYLHSQNGKEEDKSKSVHYFFARGFGGQYIYVIPSLDSVVVLTHDSKKKNQQRDLFREVVAPWLLRQQTSLQTL